MVIHKGEYKGPLVTCGDCCASHPYLKKCFQRKSEAVDLPFDSYYSVKTKETVQ